jgi:hypothetical protein
VKREHLTLTDADRTYLQDLIKKGSLPANTCKRALTLLEPDRGRTFTEVVEIVGVVGQSTSDWAQKYKESGLEFLDDIPRPGRPPVINGDLGTSQTILAMLS